jgi:putative membrane-bound dehydrogenase-like protein
VFHDERIRSSTLKSLSRPGTRPHRRWRHHTPAHRAGGWFPALALFIASSIAGSAADPLGNLSPDQALAAFETEPGFIVEQVAAEPLVIDPVALAFDEQGRLFVAEDRDYPIGSPDGRPQGVIALLEDRDHDGRLETRHEFATGIAFPNGLMCWRGGVVVTASPNVYWLADTNDDGRADLKETWLTGFDTNATSQLRANDPTLGPDGWIHFAGGLRGGRVGVPDRPGEFMDTDKGDPRFHPDTRRLALDTGKSQYGLAL